MDIPNYIIDEINIMIKTYFWKDLHQNELKVLSYPYEEGGLNLENILLKMKTLRIIWLTDLGLTDKQLIERWLADYLIENNNHV